MNMKIAIIYSYETRKIIGRQFANDESADKQYESVVKFWKKIIVRIL